MGTSAPQARVLGYSEQPALYNAANFQFLAYNDVYGVPANTTTTGTRLSLFMCPSNTPPGWLMNGMAPLGTMVAPGTTYFASVGSSMEWNGQMSAGPPNGPFATTLALGIRDITDGTSNTVAFGEWKTGSGTTAIFLIPSDITFVGVLPTMVSRNTPLTSMPAGSGPFYTMSGSWVAQCAAAQTTKRLPKTPTLGQSWAFGVFGYTMGTILLPPNSRISNCGTNPGGALDGAGMMNLASYHPGGANIGMCDGSVRFLKDSVSIQAIWKLGSIAQGEVMSADEY